MESWCAGGKTASATKEAADRIVNDFGLLQIAEVSGSGNRQEFGAGDGCGDGPGAFEGYVVNAGNGESGNADVF